MNPHFKVVLFGSSMLMAGVEATLNRQQELNVVRIDEPPPLELKHLIDRDPEVVILDLTSLESESILSWLKAHRTLRFVGLDAANDAVIVLSGRWHVGLTGSDLAQIIQGG